MWQAPDLPHLGHGILDQPLISFGPEIAADLPGALRREWLVTNGLGGYASGTLAGVNTRRYHGLLVAALAPTRGAHDAGGRIDRLGSL